MNLLEINKNKIRQKGISNPSSGAIRACDIDEREGKLMAVGGVDSKIYLLGINPDAKRKEKTN